MCGEGGGGGQRFEYCSGNEFQWRVLSTEEEGGNLV